MVSLSEEVARFCEMSCFLGNGIGCHERELTGLRWEPPVQARRAEQN